MNSFPRRAAWTLALALACAAPAPAQEVTAQHDFRASNFDTQMLSYSGANAGNYVMPTEEGLRIRFAAGDVPKEPIGVAWRTRVVGNFVATARYEVLQNETPKRGSGVGVELYLMLDNPHRDGIAFARLIHTAQGLIVVYNHLTNNQEGKRVGKMSERIPTTDASKRGRLRLARTGNEVIASIAKGDDDEFQEIVRENIGEADLRLVRFAGLPGGDPTATLEIRLLDFQLKGDLPGLDGLKLRSSKMPAAPGEEPAVPEPPPRTRWLLLGVLLLAMGFAFAISAVFLVVKLRKRASTPTPVSAAKQTEADDPEHAPARVHLSCAACGQKIKFKDSMAGKRVKCPACGEPVQVPSTEEK